MKETYRDVGMAVGTHAGNTGATILKAKDIDFKLAGAEDRLISNDSDGSTGTVRSTTYMDSLGYSTLSATLSGGTLNTWTNGASWTLYITDTANQKISSTEICRMSGFAAPKEYLVDGALPEFDDIDQETMTTNKRT